MTSTAQPSTPTQTARVQSGLDAPALLANPGLRLWAPILTHSVTDFLSFVTIALMPLLAVRLGMSSDQKAMLLGIGTAASGGVQPIVAWINDRFDSRLTGILGLALAGVCIGSIGYAQTYPTLLVLFFFGIVGVGAFHPAAAAVVGQLAGKRRSAMLSVFFLFGMIGGIAGNVLSPQFVNAVAARSGLEGDAAVEVGLKALVWFIPLAIVSAVFLGWAVGRVPHRHNTAHDHHASLSGVDRKRRWAAFWLLYAANCIRFTVNLMLVYLIIEWIERVVAQQASVESIDIALGQRASALNGPLQGTLQVGMGAGAIAIGFLLPARHEKKAFVIIPLIGAAAIALIPFTDAFLPRGMGTVAIAAGLLATCAGFGFGSLVPVSLSLGQRLLPHRTSFASGVMLGGAWCVAFVGPQIARLIHDHNDANLETGFIVAAGMLAIASILAAWLPGKLIGEIAPH